MSWILLSYVLTPSPRAKKQEEKNRCRLSSPPRVFAAADISILVYKYFDVAAIALIFTESKGDFFHCENPFQIIINIRFAQRECGAP